MRGGAKRRQWAGRGVWERSERKELGQGGKGGKGRGCGGGGKKGGVSVHWETWGGLQVMGGEHPPYRDPPIETST